jgi:hypothetical protein
MNLDLTSRVLDRGIHPSGEELLDESCGFAFGYASPASCPKSASASPFGFTSFAFSTNVKSATQSGRSIIRFAVLDLTS